MLSRPSSLSHGANKEWPAGVVLYGARGFHIYMTSTEGG